MSEAKFGIIGCGKMGQALLGGVLESGVFPASTVTAHDKYAPAVEAAVAKYGVSPADSNRAVAENADVILLAVKPQDMVPMLAELTGLGSSRLLISIAAGVTINAIETAARQEHRVIRVMPNTPALVGKGASAYALGTGATDEDAALTEKILGAVGFVTRVEEPLLDAVTALSGSGPAYIFAMIESLIKGAVDEGLDEKTALDLATHTVAGAAELLLQTGQSPTKLRENVTSPNGTTFAALESLRAAGFDAIIGDAVAAAANRSRELGQA